MTTLDPFIVAPILVERPWGGDRLVGLGKPVPEGVRIGESWEVADLAPEVAPHLPVTSCAVASGPLVGRSLHEVMDRHGDSLMGEARPTDDGRFPLLVKLLDAGEPLSIQVHPDAGYVDDHPAARLKTESWYIVSADDGASLYLDVEDGVTREDLASAFGSPAMLDLLRSVPASTGEFHHVPAGLIHSLGAGSVVAEVQTPSDTTFRLYDWSKELGRSPRPLHRDEALASLRLHPPEAFSLATSTESRSLIDNSHYGMSERRLAAGRHALGRNGGPIVVMAVGGKAELGDLPLPVGTTAIVPASTPDVEVTVAERAVLLEITLPV